MKYFLIFVLTLSTNIISAQSIEDYNLLNEIIPSLLNVKINDTINIHENQTEFLNQDNFFTKDFLKLYTYPTLGVDCKKVRRLINTLDFNYLAKQKFEVSKWDFSKTNDFKINNYDDSQILNNKKQFKISRPILTKDQKIAFVFYMDICGSMDCSSTTVKVFKKKKGKWLLYVQIPITIS